MLVGGFEWMHAVGYGPLDEVRPHFPDYSAIAEQPHDETQFVPAEPAPLPTVPPYEADDAFAAPLGPVEPLLPPDDGTGPFMWLDDVPALLRSVDAPEAWIGDITAIAKCESGRWDDVAERWYVRFGATGDQGASLGFLQNWATGPTNGWWGDDIANWRDPQTAARVGVSVRARRGHYGGPGGWSCADLLGID